MDWARKWLIDFNARKAQLVSFDQSNNAGAIDLEIDGSVFEGKSSFKMLGLPFSAKLDWDSYVVSVAKTVSQKIGVLTHSMKLLSPKVPLYLYKSTILPCMKYCCHVWDGAPSCYKNSYVGLFVHHHHLLLLLNPLAPHQNAESLSYRYYVGSFPCTDKLLNSLPIECFPLTYDQSDFQSRINHGTITGTGITCKEILL